MKYIDGFRNAKAALALRRQIETLCAKLGDRVVSIMEVCGSHTMAIARYGIRDLLPGNVRLISGPGCPVCVTGSGYIDAAIALAEQGCVAVTFGDMLPVPGSRASLAAARARGARIEVCYSPATAVELAGKHADREVVFLAVGFETTVAPVATLVGSAEKAGCGNLSLLTAFKLVPPALHALIADPAVRLDALLCPAHVSAVIGSEAYRPFAEAGVPCVVAGFEPLDILYGLVGLLEQISSGESRVDNQYSRVVKPNGNPVAQKTMRRYLEPCDAHWRGIGTIPASGLALRAEFAAYDAAKRFGIQVGIGEEAPGCQCGAVIKGVMTPPECPLFGTRCVPDDPVGPCMVSSEGSCAAYYKYQTVPS